MLEHLETVPIDSAADEAKPFRMPVQWVNRPDQHFRGFAGQVASGRIGPGSEVRILPSGRMTKVARIVTMPALIDSAGGGEGNGDLEEAVAGQSVTLTLAKEIDCSRGDVIAAAKDPPHAADQFEATIVWMADEPMIAGRGYWLKLGTQTATATVAQPKHQLNVNTLEELAAKTLELNAIGVAEVTTDRALVFEPYRDEHGGAPNRALGGFILIDKLTNATVAAGMLHFALRRAENVHWQALDVSRETHSRLKGQKPAVLWFTGLSGAGKSTIANLVEKKLAAMGRHTFLLDGDNVRHGLNKDLGFTETDRIENIRRVGEVAKLMADAGLIVLTAFISPFRAERDMVRRMMAEGEFIEIFVDTPLGEAEKRDVKGLYAKARAGELPNFTGIDSPYEAPEEPELRIDTTQFSAEEAAEKIVEVLLSTRLARSDPAGLHFGRGDHPVLVRIEPVEIGERRRAVLDHADLIVAIAVLARQHRQAVRGRWGGGQLREFGRAQEAVLVRIKLHEVGAIASLGVGEGRLILKLLDLGVSELAVLVGIHLAELAVHLGDELGARDRLGDGTLDQSPPLGRGTLQTTAISAASMSLSCSVSLAGLRREIFVVFAFLALMLVGIGGSLVVLARDVGPLGREIGVELQPFFKPALGVGQDRLGRAFGLADAAIDAFVGIDGEHILALVETVDRTDLDAVHIFAFNAGVGDDVGHGEKAPSSLRSLGRGGSLVNLLIGLSRLGCRAATAWQRSNAQHPYSAP